MKNKITDLRNHLFETIERLKDEERPMDIDRAEAIAEVADRIIDTAKVEVDLLKVVGGTGTDFIPDADTGKPPALPKPPELRRLK